MISPDLSIVIVNWNVCDLLEQCLTSILAQAASDPQSADPGVWKLSGQKLPAPHFEVLVVDSASSDGSVQMVRERFPDVRLYASEVNLGYAAGNNLGIRHSRGDYILILNPDTRVLPGALGAMLGYAVVHPDVGVLGPQLRYPNGSVQSSRRRFPTFGTALIESTFLQKWFPHHPTLRRYYVLDRPDDAIGEVDWLNGSCLLVRRAVIEQVGDFDEAYFMYSEELDWQKRMREVGWKVVYFPAAQVVHYEGKSSEQVVAFRHIRFQKSKIRYFKKHHGTAAGEILRYWLLMHYLFEWMVEGLKWLLGHKRDLRRQRLDEYGQVLRTWLV